MKKRLTLLSLLTISSLLGAQTQEYPHLSGVIVQAEVFYNAVGQMFHYRYAITNGDKSRGEISSFEIDISVPPNALQLDTVGLRFEDDGFTERSFKRHYDYLKGKIVPVGFLRTPPGKWIGVLANALTASFSGVGDGHILPGQRLGGFELMSKGLPGIRRCIVSPFFDVIALFPDPNDTTITYYVPPVDSVRNAVKFHTFTIGPTAPPANFAPVLFLDTLISYKHQAFALGWIKEEGIVASLDAKLEAARVQILNDRPSAKHILQSFVNELDALNAQGNQITSEAYALLKFNAQYLISKL